MADQPELSKNEWVLSVMEQYEGRLMRYATRLTADAELARDVVQHTFMKLCEEQPAKLRRSVAPWLFTVCRNRALELVRKERRMEPLTEEKQSVCTSPDPDPALEAETRDAARQLRVVVDSLPSKQQEVIDLWSEGMNYREIGQITQRTEGNVRVMVFRAFKQIREHPVMRQLPASNDGVESARAET